MAYNTPGGAFDVTGSMVYYHVCDCTCSQAIPNQVSASVDIMYEVTMHISN